MLRRVGAGLLICAIIATPVLAAPTAPVSLARTSKWEMKYDEDACTLAAQFGQGKDAALLTITRFDPGDGFEMKFYANAMRYGGGIGMPIDVAFGSQPAVRYLGLAAKSNNAEKTPVVMIGGLRIDGWLYPKKEYDSSIKAPAVTPEQEAAVTSITLKAIGKKPVRLESGSMAGPMRAMRDCTEDLLKHWGFDPAVEASLTTRATPISNPGTWLGSRDFPSDALYKGENGLVRFRLDVEPSGQVSGCRVLYRTNPDSFADLSCKLIKDRAKFTPALNRQGEPVKSYYMSQVRWVSGGSW